MKTFKKKDFENKNIEPIEDSKEEIDELVDPDGSPIGGAATGHNTSEIRTAPQQTSDEFVDSARQGPRPWFGNYGTAYSHGVRRSGSGIYEDEEVVEARIKMDKMLEDVFTKKGKDNDIVTKEKKNIKTKIINALEKCKGDEDTEIFKELTKIKDEL